MIVGRYKFYGNNLYFLNSHGDEEEIREVPDGSSEHDVLGMVLEDLKNRNPEYKSYYQRMWMDDYQRFWIDVGSHTEFYIVRSKDFSYNKDRGGTEE